jgi:hypothetical protein
VSDAYQRAWRAVYLRQQWCLYLRTNPRALAMRRAYDVLDVWSPAYNYGHQIMKLHAARKRMGAGYITGTGVRVAPTPPPRP